MAIAKQVDTENVDVAIIGAGPAGLAAATALKEEGIEKVTVIERESAAGGIPRHCGHPPFGWREFGRVLTGPAYASRLVRTAQQAGVDIRLSTSVVKAERGGNLSLAHNGGGRQISARRVIYATGVRETPRSARMISGPRLSGVVNTGALQSMIYLENRRPFKSPVIVGSELVSFSAIMTCRHAGVKPVAMIEKNPNVTARWPSEIYPLLHRIPLLKGAEIWSINGEDSVSSVTVKAHDGSFRNLACDGVILTGMFTPEFSLALCGHLEIDPSTRGPVVDQYGRCSDPAYFAAGNILRPVETAGWSWKEGRECGRWVALDLKGRLPPIESQIRLKTSGDELNYVMPQMISLPLTVAGMENCQLRVSRAVKGELVVRTGQRDVFRQKIAAKPQRRVLLPIGEFFSSNLQDEIELEIIV